jgi:hypothetical protein
MGHNGAVTLRFRCRWKRKGALLWCATLLALSSCSTAPTNYAKPPVVAKAYFTAMSVHHWADAAALLKPSMRDSFLHGPGSAPNDVASISHIQVVPGGPDPTDESGAYAKLYLPYSDLWELSVNYDIAYTPNSYDRETYAHNGLKTVFIILGRRDGAGPWRLIEIGSGP